MSDNYADARLRPLLLERDRHIAEVEAENERFRIALVVIQSTAPGSAHRIAIQALAERGKP